MIESNDLMVHDLDIVDFHLHFPVKRKRGRRKKKNEDYKSEYDDAQKREKEKQVKYFHEERIKA